MSIQPPHQIGGSGEDITTLSNNTTLTVMDSRKKRAYGKRKNCGGDATNATAVVKKRKDCGDTPDTPAVTETKKRAYKRKDRGGDATGTSTSVVKKRKDCGDTPDIPTVRQRKKRAYKRKDCGGDATDTSTTVVKKRKDSGGDTTSTPTVMEIKKKRPYTRKKCLPHDLISEEILTKLPVLTLLRSVLVSKRWYHSIHNDYKRLTYSHFLQSRKQPNFVLSLINVREGVVIKEGVPRYGCHLFKLTTGMMYGGIKNVLEFNKFRGGLADHDVWELVGYCNGLPCMALARKYSTAYIVLDPNRRDFLKIFHPARVGRKHIPSTRIICHGFGFDPTANMYKLVSIFRTPEKELNILVYTLGTKSWRNVTATSTHVSGHGGRPILKIRAPTGSDKSAIFCSTSSTSNSSCLAWKIIATLGGAGSNAILHDNGNDLSDEMEMLLSFDLHGEKFQFSQLPAKSTADEQQKHLLVDYPHLLGFKGFPCIARIEKISGNGSDPHRCRDDHQVINRCCCCCKVHLYVLKDNVKQLWVKDEIFDVRINSTLTWSGHQASDPCCFCFGSGTTPPTRIFSFSDQMLLYWFSGNYLQVYNLRSEKLQLVLPSYFKDDVIFGAKMKEPRHIFISSGDDIYFSNMDYQLHCHEENFLSLQTFIPEGVKGVNADDFLKLDWKRENRPCSVYVFICRGSKVYYPFLN